MNMLSSRVFSVFRNFSSSGKNQSQQNQFEPVFSFPYVKYISLVNRLKIYHIYGTCAILPGCYLMETFQALPQGSFLAASYIGATGAAVLSLFTFPLRNIIGHLYISEDNKQIKISSVGFSGKRIDKIITVDQWIPMLDMKPRNTDVVYLQPQLTDGTKYKLFINFGIVKNSTKMSQVLE